MLLHRLRQLLQRPTLTPQREQLALCRHLERCGTLLPEERQFVWIMRHRFEAGLELDPRHAKRLQDLDDEVRVSAAW